MKTWNFNQYENYSPSCHQKGGRSVPSAKEASKKLGSNLNFTCASKSSNLTTANSILTPEENSTVQP